MFREQVYPNLY